MKNLILILGLLIGLSSYSQIGFGIYQDPSLAFFKDDHGNVPFTLDWRIEADMQVAKGDYGGMLIGIIFEYADLSEFKFIRYGAQGGYTFGYMHLPFSGQRETYELTLMGGFAKIIRGTDTTTGTLSLELTAQADYYFTDWFAASIKTTMMQRGDLLAKYDDPAGSYRPWEWKPNIYLGIKIRIPTYQPTKTAN